MIKTLIKSRLGGKGLFYLHNLQSIMKVSQSRKWGRNLEAGTKGKIMNIADWFASRGLLSLLACLYNPGPPPL